MPAPTEKNLLAKIEQILLDEKFVGDTSGIAAELKRFAKTNTPLPHSLHLNVVDHSERPLHMRVLTRSSEIRRQERRLCIADHRRIHAAVERKPRSFRVPALVRFGETPLMWDCSAFVDAENLPWSFPGKRQLRFHLDRIDEFIAVSDDMAELKLKDVAARDWPSFVADIKRWASWSLKVEIIDQSLRNDLHRLAQGFLAGNAHRAPVLTHGDFGPNNIMFSRRGKPWLIDFDDLRMSVVGDNLARLLTVSYFEAAWRDALFIECQTRFADDANSGFAAAAAWHTLNHWHHVFYNYAPVKGIKSVDELVVHVPNARYHLTQQRKLLIRILQVFR